MLQDREGPRPPPSHCIGRAGVALFGLLTLFCTGVLFQIDVLSLSYSADTTYSDERRQRPHQSHHLPRARRTSRSVQSQAVLSESAGHIQAEMSWTYPDENLRRAGSIFAEGPLLKAVQLASPPLFADSKHFVDMPLR